MSVRRQVSSIELLAASLGDVLTPETLYVEIVTQFVVYGSVHDVLLEPVHVWGRDRADLLSMMVQSVIQPLAPNATFCEGVPSGTDCVNNFPEAADILARHEGPLVLEVRGVVQFKIGDSAVEVEIAPDGLFLKGVQSLMYRLVERRRK
jgi:hypothetical protein